MPDGIILSDSLISSVVLEDSTIPEIVLDGGMAGPPGVPGADGVGIPTGGTTGQVLEKSSNADYATAWTTNSGADKNFSQAFISQSTVVVAHNLGKYPAVTVIDSAGDEVEGFVDHNSTNQLTITFSASFSGTVICN